jgi:hypothetical protein
MIGSVELQNPATSRWALLLEFARLKHSFDGYCLKLIKEDHYFLRAPRRCLRSARHLKPALRPVPNDDLDLLEPSYTLGRSSSHPRGLRLIHLSKNSQPNRTRIPPGFRSAKPARICRKRRWQLSLPSSCQSVIPDWGGESYSPVLSCQPSVAKIFLKSSRHLCEPQNIRGPGRVLSAFLCRRLDPANQLLSVIRTAYARFARETVNF